MDEELRGGKISFLKIICQGNLLFLGKSFIPSFLQDPC